MRVEAGHCHLCGRNTPHRSGRCLVCMVCPDRDYLYVWELTGSRKSKDAALEEIRGGLDIVPPGGHVAGPRRSDRATCESRPTR